MQNKFVYGEFEYKYYLFFENRKSFSLIVYPNQNIVLKAPVESDKSDIEKFLVKKWVWLENTLKEFEKYRKSRYVKKYLSGESIYYLGRQYIINVIAGENDGVKISSNKIIISTTKLLNDSEYNFRLIENWLNSRRRVVYKQQLLSVWKEFGYERFPQIKMREMNKRWGSCSKDNRVITLNTKLIEAPTEAIRYVCTHDLSHIKYRDDNTDCYR